MLSGISQKHSVRSITYCFTEFCNSQCYHNSLHPSSLFEPRHPSLNVVPKNASQWHRYQSHIKTSVKKERDSEARQGLGQPCPPAPGLGTRGKTPHAQSLTQVRSRLLSWMRANDPSAGSPTATLLRLLLPLSDKVH